MKDRYQNAFNRIRLSDAAKDRLLNPAQKEQKSMKIHWRKSFTLALACMLCLCITAFAASRIHFVSSVKPDSLTADYAAVEQAQKEIGLKFNCPTTLGNDFTFMNMNVNDGEYFDENGGSLGTYQAIFISYLNDNGEALILEVRPENSLEREQTANDPEQTEVSPGYYSETESQESDSPLQMKSFIWYADGNRYELSGYNLSLDAEAFAEMAKEIEK